MAKSGRIMPLRADNVTQTFVKVAIKKDFRIYDVKSAKNIRSFNNKLHLSNLPKGSGVNNSAKFRLHPSPRTAKTGFQRTPIFFDYYYFSIMPKKRFRMALYICTQDFEGKKSKIKGILQNQQNTYFYVSEQSAFCFLVLKNMYFSCGQGLIPLFFY